MSSRHDTLAAVSILACAGLAWAQPSGLSLSFDSRKVQLVENGWGAQGWRLKFRAYAADPDAVVTVTAIANSHPIEYIKLECDQSGSHESKLKLEVR